jgi:hypothetical protein
MSDSRDWYGPVTEKYSTQKYPAGTKRETDTGDKTYRFVKIKNAVDAAVGSTLKFLSGTTTWEVTVDVTGGADGEGVGRCCGVSPIINDVSDLDVYQWMQTKGQVNVLANNDDDVAAGNYLVHEGDGLSDIMADGEEEMVFGYALDAVVAATNLVSAFIYCE